MRSSEVINPEQALLYLLDCNLATVEYYSTVKKISKSEFKRQIEIAQKTLDWVCAFRIELESNSRAKEIKDNCNHSVEEWLIKM